MLIFRSWIVWLYCFSGLYKSITCQKLPRIANGQDADIKDFPFMAALISTRYKGHLCGGSIISEIYILTAAHCFEECQDGEEKYIIESNEIYVRVGSTNWKYGGQTYDVDAIYPHPKFDSFGRKDIGIIKIKGQFSFSDTVKTIPIYPRSKVPIKGEVTLAGWGRTHPDIIVSFEFLQKTEHEITSQNECKKYYHKIASSHFCTRHKNKSAGSCPGDSGGPVIYKGQIIGVIVGMVKDDCWTSIAPHVHTKVSSYKKWINTYLKHS